MKGLDLSEEFEQAHPLIAFLTYIAESLAILVSTFLLIAFVICLLFR